MRRALLMDLRLGLGRAGRRLGGRNRRRLQGRDIATLTVAGIAVVAGLAAPAAAVDIEQHEPKVAIIVGPVGASLTPQYIALAESVASTATTRGAAVARAYSPSAGADEVLNAVDGASIVVYFGHGNGFPSRYSSTLDPATANGWGLQGPNARGTHEDSWRDGTLAYYGEEWIAANARPAPGFVMIYSNACYAPGAPDGGVIATPDEAAARVGYYSRGPLAMGASAYFATDYYGGAARLVEAILSSPTTTYGAMFRAEPRYAATGLETRAHPFAAGRDLWLHRSAYFNNQVNYWYAFAGDPNATPIASFGAPAGETYDPPRSVVLRAGEHVGYQFGPEGEVAETREVTLRENLTARAIERGSAPGQSGAWFQISDGPLAGYWVPESAASHLPGFLAQTTLYGSTRVTFAPGSHTGYTFAADGMVAATHTEEVTEPSSAVASARAVINGVPHLLVADGVFSGYWIVESDGAELELVEVEGTTPSAAPTASPSLSTPAPASGGGGASGAPAPSVLPVPTAPVVVPPAAPTQSPAPTPSPPPTQSPAPTQAPVPTPSGSPSVPPLPTPVSPLV